MLGQAPFSVTAKVSNHGLDTITYFSINYKINGSQVVSGNINSVNVFPSSTHTFTHPIPWVPSSTGMYTVDIWASNLNGGNDEDTTNDHFIFNVAVVDTFVGRNTCIEVFTGTWCHPCHVVNNNFDNNVLPNLSHYTLIKYHIGNDPYRSADSEVRYGYYSLQVVPTFKFDGQEDDPTQAAFNSYQTIPAFMAIDIASATYFDSTVNVRGAITPLLDTGEYLYHIIVIEKENSTYPNGIGDTIFNCVELKMSPPAGNSILSVTAKSPIIFNHEIPLPLSHVQKMTDLQVVVFVQHFDSKKIMQSAWRDIVHSDTVIEIRKEIVGLNIYPNPANDIVTLKATLSHFDHYVVTLTDVAGRQLAMIDGESSASLEKEIDVSKLAPGIYFISLKLSGGSVVEKFVKE